MSMNGFIDRLCFNRFRQLPHFRSPGILVLPVKQRVMVFAPHSDDEWIGCAGTLARLKQNDCVIRVVIVTDGARGDPDQLVAGDVSNIRRNESRAALGELEIDDISFLGYPDGDLAAHGNELTAAVARVYDEFAPDWVFTTALGEHHRDHICTGYAVMRHWLAKGMRERLLAFEVYGAIRLDWLVDITEVMELKRKGLRHYQIPLSYVDYEAACVTLARYRGIFVGSALEENFAEGFMEIRRRDVCGDVIGALM